jgi:hypothetical protein
MNAEIPKNAVVVPDSEPLATRLKEHPLGPGQYYYFLSDKTSDGLGLPTEYDLYTLFGKINTHFLTERGIDPESATIDNGQTELFSEIQSFINNGQANTNS